MAVHFVRFARFDQHYWNAVSVWGAPDFMHLLWDRRSQREMDDGDTVVFAKGDFDQPFSYRNGDDESYL